MQGYDHRKDPLPIELSWPWERKCVPPLRAEGTAALSKLFSDTQAISYKSASLRGPAFVKMEQHINKSPSLGFLARHVVGWNQLGRRAFGSGRNVPRVDLEVIKGRAFGDF